MNKSFAELKKKSILYLPVAAVAVLLLLILWLLMFVYLYDIPLYDAAGAASFRIFYIVLCCLAGFLAALFFHERSYAAFFVSLGICLLLVQGLILLGYRFEGMAGVGEGEEIERLDVISKGFWAEIPRIPLRLISVSTGDKGQSESCNVVLDGRAVEIEKGRDLVWAGMRIRMEGVRIAPLFILRNLAGEELEAGYIKLDWAAPVKPFFQFSILPHRFFVSLPDAPKERWMRSGKGWRPVDAQQDLGHRHEGKASFPSELERLHIMIMRGKLTILNKIVNKGERVEFDGHRLEFRNGAPWAIFVVKRVQSYYVFFAGVVLIIVGAVVKAIGWRKA